MEHFFMSEPETKNFKAVELRCQCELCGREVPNECDTFALRMLQKLRDKFGPLVITSAYRCENHPIEANKSSPGQHNAGVAFDIAVGWGSKRMMIVEEALKLGAKGFGFANTFLHVDWRLQGEPTSWGYS